MLTKKNVWILLLVTVLSLLVVYLIVDNINKTNSLENMTFSQVSIDEKFIYYLNLVQEDFGLDFLKITDQKERNDKFANSVADLSAAVALSEHTSYDEVNKDLDITLYSLLAAMKDKGGKAIDVMTNSNILYNGIKDIVFAPKDPLKTKVLSDYIASLH